MATIAATNPPPPPRGGGGAINAADALKYIDINCLSQSELQALSLTSNSSFDVRRTDDVVSPTLDRSIFNESAGSRRQTYSRLHHRSHSRFPGLHPSVKPHKQFSPSSDPVTHSIVHYFKHLLDGNHNPPPPPVPQPQVEVPVLPELGFIGLEEEEEECVKSKRKRAKKRKGKRKSGDSEVELQKVNGKGVVVDFGELEKNGDELFEGELKRRTVGMESEEAVLEFLSDLDGQWCSRRRRRKYVDAGLFGDALPVGWKVLLGLRRRDYRVSVYCRRYISPTGQQFMSCREAASFLTSYFGSDDVDPQSDQKTCSIQQAYVMSSLNNKQSAERPDEAPSDLATQTAASNSSNGHQNDEHLMGIENLPDVNVQDIFECVKCNLSFDEKNVYLQHLFAYHQKTTKRYRVGTPVGEGVIIRDGKFECQFCHKVFEEKRSYSGHVGSHVRNTGKNAIELPTPVTVKKHPEPPLHLELPSQPLQLEFSSQPLQLEFSSQPLQLELPSQPLQLDATIEVPQMSTAETQSEQILTIEVPQSKNVLNNQSTNVLNLEPQVACSNDDDKANLSSDAFEVQTESSKLTPDAALQIEGSTLSSVPVGIQSEDSNLNSVPVGVQSEEFNADNSPSGQLNHIVQGAIENNDMVRNDYQWDIDINMDANSFNDSVHVIEEYGNSNLGMDIGRNDHLEDTPGLNVGDIVFQDRDSSLPLAQSFDFFPSYDSASQKEHEFPIVDQKLENVTGFEELRFDDDIEPFKYGFTSGQELPSLPGCSINFGTDGRIEDGFDSSVRYQPQEVMLNTVEMSQLTVCVWCRTEFRLEGIELETPSDSIGYMCPTCKARISGHFSAGLSMGHTGF